ncbi:MAG: radical SAM protein [Clostridia bacterium]
MQYFGRIFRPPSEARSLIVQATIGCSHNKCTFCDMYKEKRFQIRKVSDVIKDFEWARKQYPYVERIFLADGDALMMKTEHLLEILQYIKKTFPECKRVTSYGSPKSILIKTQEQLNSLAKAGLYMVYMGLESGNEQILRDINKGETADEIVRAGIMVKTAGILLSVTAISGLGGKALCSEHAVDTGKAFSRMKPDFIGILTLMIEDGTEMQRRYLNGDFELLSPQDVARETLLLLENLDCEGTVFRSNHASNYLSLSGTLNYDKDIMIRQVKSALDGKLSFKKEKYRGI